MSKLGIALPPNSASIGLTPLVTRLKNLARGTASTIGNVSPVAGFLAVAGTAYYVTPLVIHGWDGTASARIEQPASQAPPVVDATPPRRVVADTATVPTEARHIAALGSALYGYAASLLKSSSGSSTSAPSDRAGTASAAVPVVHAPRLTGPEKLNRWTQALGKAWQGDARPAPITRSNAGSAAHAQAYTPHAAGPSVARQTAPTQRAQSFPAPGGYSASPHTDSRITGSASGRSLAPTYQPVARVGGYRPLPHAVPRGGFRNFSFGGGHFGHR